MQKIADAEKFIQMENARNFFDSNSNVMFSFVISCNRL